MIPLSAIILLLVPCVHAEEPSEFEVPPILLEGESPAEGLHELNPVPAQEEAVIPATSSGTIDTSLTQDLAVPVTPATEPGGLSQIRGLGRSAEEVSVEAFGVPLNPAQGGGFNFSIFPQYIWSSFEYRTGPVIGGSDPRAIAGGLVLRPWTAERAAEPGTRSRLTSFYTGEGLGQFSTAYDAGNSALLVGWSVGAVRGPTTSASFQFGDWALHVLGTSLDLDTPGSTSVLKSRRIIPVLQNESKPERDRVYRTSLFYDGGQQEFTDPATDDTTHQFGVEHAAFVGNWTYGGAFRHIRFSGTTFDPPSETQLYLRAMRKFDLTENFSIQPGVQAIGVSHVGAFPEGLVAAERRLPDQMKIYARIGLSRRIPSLLDRYYQVPATPPFYAGYSGNADLKPEAAWSATLGIAQKANDGWTWDLGVFAQVRSDAIVRTNLPDGRETLTNTGDASIGSLLALVQKEISARWEIRASGTVSASNVEATGQDFPYLPDVLGVLSLIYRAPLKDPITHEPKWRISANGRASSAFNAGFDRLGGYAYFDLQGEIHLWDGVMLAAQFDNFTGRSIVLVAGSPPMQRSLSAMVSASF